MLPATTTSNRHRGARPSAKRVRYRADVRETDGEKRRTAVPRRKEDIPIPAPPPRRVSAAEKLLALIMAPNDRPSRLHGLHGKKLMCVRWLRVERWGRWA